MFAWSWEWEKKNYYRGAREMSRVLKMFSVLIVIATKQNTIVKLIDKIVNMDKFYCI